MSNQKSKITILSSHQTNSTDFTAEYLLFYLEHGKNKLKTVWCQTENPSAPYLDDYYTLFLEDTPLVNIQSSGCPTCESLLAAGYGIPENQKELREVCQRLNAPHSTLTDALERLFPLIALLSDGFYILSSSEYYPTDGNGHFFWRADNQFTPLAATADLYESRNYRTLSCPPSFLYPSQPHSKFNPNRVDYYRNMLSKGQPFPYAVTYCLLGSVSILLDGHHRACAAALEEKPMPCFTIAEASMYWNQGCPTLRWPDGKTISYSPDKKQTTQLQKKTFRNGKKCCAPPSQGHLFSRDWGKEYDEAAARFPTYEEAVSLYLYGSRKLSIERLNDMLQMEESDEFETVCRLISYFSRQKNADLKALAFSFTQKHYSTELRKIAFQILDKCKGDSEVDDFFVNFLIYSDDRNSPLFTIADHHWDHS